MKPEDIKFDHYMPYDELMAACSCLAEAYPHLIELTEIGRSYEGRSVVAAIITAKSTGPASDKPAFICDGNIHATEVSASSACLHLIHTLATQYESDERIYRALNTRVFYIIPRLNPDGAEQYFADPPRFLRSSTRPYPYDEEDIEGLEMRDINGDGKILTMRVPDPNGPWKISDLDSRLMVIREPDEVGGRYFRLLPEGEIKNYDGFMLKMKRNKERLDLNRNFPAHWRPEGEQHGAGPFPGSEPEVRNLVKFVTEHPNITGGLTFHTFSGVLLRPCSTISDDDMSAEDVWTYNAIGNKGSEITGYPNVSVFHDFRYHPNEVITGTYDDWLYESLGLFGWTIEIWSPQRQAGITDGFAPGGKRGSYKFTTWHRDHPVSDDIQMLKWSDEKLDGKGFIEWQPFEHPQLGSVEIGGWDVQIAFRNPPESMLEAEIAPLTQWAIWHCLISPKLELLHCSSEPVGDHCWKITAVVANTGWLPSYVTKQALKQKTVRGTVAEITLPDGATLISGEERIIGPQLEGRAYESSAAFGWVSAATDDRAKFEWVVQSPKGGTAALKIGHARAGTVRAEVSLES